MGVVGEGEGLGEGGGGGSLVAMHNWGMLLLTRH